MRHHEHAAELQRRFDVLHNFIVHHHSKASRPADERIQLDEAILIYKELIMELFNKAVADAISRVAANDAAKDAKIKDLEATIAAASPTAVADAVAAATAGMIPEQAAVDAVATIAPTPAA